MILTVEIVTIFHGLSMGRVGLVEVGKGAEGSAILVDFSILPLLEGAAEHKSNYCKESIRY